MKMLRSARRVIYRQAIFRLEGIFHRFRRVDFLREAYHLEVLAAFPVVPVAFPEEALRPVDSLVVAAAFLGEVRRPAADSPVEAVEVDSPVEVHHNRDKVPAMVHK